MKASELINILRNMIRQHGDVEIWTTHEWSDMVIEIEYQEEYFDDHFHEYWPDRIDIRGGGSYDHTGEYMKRKSN